MLKVSELTGDELDRWVAKAEGHRVQLSPWDEWEVLDAKTSNLVERTGYSYDWAQGGPIIERERIGFVFNGEFWTAWPTPSDPTNQMRGPTPLVAAMRAYVASKFGEEVEEIA
jgi:hypothetical protein